MMCLADADASNNGISYFEFGCCWTSGFQ